MVGDLGEIGKTSPLAGEVAEQSEVGGGNQCGAVTPSVGFAESSPARGELFSLYM